jgi:hypothetical protein
MVVKVDGTTFCGFLVLNVDREDLLSGKLQNKSGYSGAQLIGLSYTGEAGDLQYSGLDSIED